jgi:hypothetical protein
MSVVYVFEGSVIKISRERYVGLPSKGVPGEVEEAPRREGQGDRGEGE